MPQRQGRGVWFVGVLGLAAVILGGAVWKFASPVRRGAKALPALVIREDSPIHVLNEGIRRGDGNALAFLRQRFQVKPKEVKALTDEEALDCFESLVAIRVNFLKYTPASKIAAIECASHVLARFAVEQTPAGWAKILSPTHEILGGGMDDPSEDVRVAALTEMGNLWSWIPGCEVTDRGAEVRELAEWKDSLYAKVHRCLAYEEPGAKTANGKFPKTRIAAIACMGRLPIDDMAAPAVAFIKDQLWVVRFQVLKSFANRPNLLDVDLLLPLLNDKVPDLAGLSERVLKARGLTQDEIGLGRLVYHPKADLRASAIPLLLNRTDIDTDNFLLHLTDDRDESVRLEAVKACAGRPAPEVLERLREMAVSDASAVVRAAALKLAPAETTAALPPLPGSPSLNPRAN